ncbi:MAG TPA: response regulator [Candidatus Acidoferrum sp.]|nr:response regulator [Candidatus Acidoferrum sp.]
MEKPLRILVLEDDATDLVLINRELRKGGMDFHSQRVETRDDFVRELEQNPPDLIFSDHGLPSFDGLAALAIARQRCPEVPFLFVTGSQTEEVAVETFSRGAADFISKSRLSGLVPAVHRALHLAEERARRRHTEQALRESQDRYRRLAKLCPDALFVQGTHRMLLAASVTAWLLDVVRRCLNLEFKAVGRITTLSVDSKSRTINLKMDLNGEPAPAELKIRGYTLREDNGAAFLELGIVETSRDWINALLDYRSNRRRVEVTGWEQVIKALL